jgi:uncharacterized protein
MLIRTLLVTLLIFVAVKFVIGILRYLQSDPSQKLSEETGAKSGVNEMVKDPVCGVYIAASEAVTVATKHGRLYFCSPKCREKFLENQV